MNDFGDDHSIPNMGQDWTSESVLDTYYIEI